MTACKLCATPTEPFDRAVILGQYDAVYHRCSVCGFIFPQDPHWLPAAYEAAITASDIGLVGRNLALAKQTQLLIRAFFEPSARFVDYGGGYGMFVRLMRDAGYDFYRHDKHCANLFAQHFEADPPLPDRSYELLTALEVFEHLEDPLASIAEMRRYADNILFTTLLVPEPPPRLDDWWYYGPEHGQHIALYSLRSLQQIAATLGYNLYSDGKGLHLLTRKRIRPLVFKLLASYRLALLLRPFLRRRSLLPEDFRRITQRELS